MDQNLPTKKTSKGTLYQSVYTNLRRRLLEGEWLPEAKLTLRGIAAELGTSAQPVREAINRLVAERVLLLRPNHCVMVPPVERRMLDELWFLRMILESEAARLCTPRLNRGDFRELDDSLRELRHYYLQHRTSPKGRIRTTHRIPFLIAERSGSVQLKNEIEILRLRTAPYYAAAAASPKQDAGFLTFSMQLQEEFINALKRGDAEMAKDLWRASI